MMIVMRTTLDLDEDVLQAAKELAEFRGVTAGRGSLRPGAKSAYADRAGAESSQRCTAAARAGPAAPIMTMKLVNELRDDE